MPKFRYQALDINGQKIEDKIDSSSEESLIDELRAKGLLILTVKRDKKSFLYKDIPLGKVAKLEEIVVFTRQLSTLVSAGVTINEAISILKIQTNNKRLKSILQDIEIAVKNGDTFSSSLGKHHKVFPSMLVNMVKAGEITGHLDETLLKAAAYLEKENSTMKKVKSALTYPVMVGIFATIVTIFLLVKVVPQFVEMYDNFGAELPLPTRIVLGFSNFLTGYWYLIFFIILMSSFLTRFLKKDPKYRYYLDYYKLKIPVFGQLMQKSIVARFTRTLSSLLAEAVPITEALIMVSQVVNNEAISRSIKEAIKSLEQGNSLHEPLQHYSVFPPLVIHMISIGERTGSLEEILNRIAEFYERDIDTTTEQLHSLIEPLMIIFLSVIVGTIILAVLTPMYGIYNLVG